MPSGETSSRVSVPEIARRLHIGRLAVYAMLEQGLLPGIRLGRRWIITRHAYEQWERTCGYAGPRWTSTGSRGNGGELMAVYKRKYDSGTTLWFYKFQRPGAARGTLPVRGFGFATRKEAQDAEADRRAEEQRKFELKKAGSGVAAAPPKTLAMLLAEFFREHAEKKLAPKTVARYREMASYLDPVLRAMTLADITPLHLSREWNRLSGKRRPHPARQSSPPVVCQNACGTSPGWFRPRSRALNGGGW